MTVFVVNLALPPPAPRYFHRVCWRTRYWRLSLSGADEMVPGLHQDEAFNGHWKGRAVQTSKAELGHVNYTSMFTHASTALAFISPYVVLRDHTVSPGLTPSRLHALKTCCDRRGYSYSRIALPGHPGRAR